MKPRSKLGISTLALMVCLGVPALGDERTASARAEPPTEAAVPHSDVQPAPLTAVVGDEGDAQPAGRLGNLPAPLRLDSRLVGTVVADAPGRSLAVMENEATGEQRVYRVGDRMGEVRIKEIRFGKVVVQTSSGDAILAVKSKGLAYSPVETPEEATSLTAHVNRHEMESALPDYTAMIREIRMRPRFGGGRPEGFVIYNIAPKSLLGRAGLEDGDVILGVNGTPFSTTQPVVEFYEALKSGVPVSFKVERDERVRDLRIEFTE